MNELISARLRRRMRENGGAPLVTYYDLASGERTELSGVTFGNWVDKTCNLLVDELMLDAGDPVELAVAQTHPGHWVSLVWALACWQVGAPVTLGRPTDARLVVCGPDYPAYAASHDLVACSMHPLGLGFAQPLPGAIVDYSLEVRAQPDSYAVVPQPGSALAWLDPERQLTQSDLVGLTAGPGKRLLVQPTDPWTTVSLALVTPLLTGGSSVIVVGSDLDRLNRIARQEQVDLKPVP